MSSGQVSPWFSQAAQVFSLSHKLLLELYPLGLITEILVVTAAKKQQEARQPYYYQPSPVQDVSFVIQVRKLSVFKSGHIRVLRSRTGTMRKKGP